MGELKTPGVFIVEKNAFPNSVVEVASAVPAFIGHTEKADYQGKSLLNRPFRISSMADFHTYFGLGPAPRFSIDEKPAGLGEETAFTLGGKDYLLNHTTGRYLLYYSMLFFFQNGGGPCYIVSVGSYADEVTADKLTKGIDLLAEEQEPTLVVIPEIVLLKEQECIRVQQAALTHCGTMGNRFAILDIWGGYLARQYPAGDCIENFCPAIGTDNLDYGAAYYPWLNTTIVQDQDLSYENIANALVLQQLLVGEPSRVRDVIQYAEDIVKITSTWDGKTEAEVIDLKSLLDKDLRAASPRYVQILRAIKNRLNLLPPAAAMAGIYTMVDDTRGVWKAPANVSLNSVVSPAVQLTDHEQEDLSPTPQGKSINAIRAFIGQGVLVWGARTLDAHGSDFQYINVRRTLILLEESVKLAAKAYVFESNDTNTWTMVKSMIQNFLTGIWKRGGLAGATPEDAFSVHIGLGETMTPQDILDGILRVTVQMAILRPAEFIVITFQQKMQKV